MKLTYLIHEKFEKQRKLEEDIIRHSGALSMLVSSLVDVVEVLDADFD